MDNYFSSVQNYYQPPLKTVSTRGMSVTLGSICLGFWVISLMLNIYYLFCFPPFDFILIPTGTTQGNSCVEFLKTINYIGLTIGILLNICEYLIFGILLYTGINKGRGNPFSIVFMIFGILGILSNAKAISGFITQNKMPYPMPTNEIYIHRIATIFLLCAAVFMLVTSIVQLDKLNKAKMMLHQS